MEKQRFITLLGPLLALCIVLISGNLAEAKPVRRIPLKPNSDWVFSILVAPGSTCSFRLPIQVKHILLGNTQKFIARAIDGKIVAVKPKTADQNLFTSLQVVLDDGRLVTVNIGVGPPETATQEVVFYWQGQSPAEVELADKKKELESKYRRKAKSLSDSFEAVELNNYMKDILGAHNFKTLTGGKERYGIGLYPRDLIRRGDTRAFVRFQIVNNSDEDYPIAQLQVIHRRQGGFLWMEAKNESMLESQLLCEDENNLIKAKSQQWCVVSFDVPERPSSAWQVAMKISEASAKSRQVYLHRIPELYE